MTRGYSHVEKVALLGQYLMAREWIVGTAESCTGGWLGQTLTSQPGASRWFHGGIIAYDNAIKADLLGISESILRSHGAVSEAVALEMAKGGAVVLKADLVVSITGVAGPGGGSLGKPVGTVWIGVHGPRGTTAERHLFSGDRDTVRSRAVDAALDTLLKAAQP